MAAVVGSMAAGGQAWHSAVAKRLHRTLKQELTGNGVGF